VERNDSGFGIVTVMIGAVTLGIFALVYVQSAQNRANFSQITTLMSFREQVMTYYSSVVANRGTWECTIRANTALQTYLRSGGAQPSGDLEIRDYSGNCQEGLGVVGGLGGTVTSGALLIGRTGRGFTRQEIRQLSTASSPSCNNAVNGTLFCLKATWKGLDTAVGQKRAVELKLTLTANRKAIKEQLGVNFNLADKEHTIFMNRAVATDCSDGRVTGYFPGSRALHPTGTGVVAYAGDAAVVNLDAVTGLVQCSGRGPLVIPPCYDVTNTTNNPFRSTSRMGRMMVNGVNEDKGFGHLTSNIGLRCDGRGRSPRTPIKGSCPRTSGGGTTAIAYFDPQTGIAQCSHPNILVEAVTTVVCDGNPQHGVVQLRGSGSQVGTFECSSDRWSNSRVGVQPGKGSCGTNQALGGFDSAGLIDSCVDGDGRGADNAMPGLSGARGERGDSAAWLHSQCRSDSRCRHQTTRTWPNGTRVTYPAGPGVGYANWRRGPDRSCPSGCFASSSQCSRCISPNCS